MQAAAHSPSTQAASSFGSLCPLHNAVRPGMEKSEPPVQKGSPTSMETNSKLHSSCQAGPQRDLSAHCYSVYRQGGGGLPEAGGKPAEICKDTIQRSGLRNILEKGSQSWETRGAGVIERDSCSSQAELQFHYFRKTCSIFRCM